DEFGGEQLAQSLRRAEQRVDDLVDALLAPRERVVSADDDAVLLAAA
ncbi:NAD(P)H dehydrogenase, partial [Mycobacterium tuberculosis]